jgi:hypothetical protein
MDYFHFDKGKKIISRGILNNAYYSNCDEMGRACGTNGGEEECI